MRIEIEYPGHSLKSYRTARVQSLFNVEDGGRFSCSAELPIEDLDWSVGLVVGPSGSGKTSIGHRMFGNAAVLNNDWPSDRAIIDVIGAGRSFDEATSALVSVGLGSVPAWLRPYKVLSNGEQFRADLARTICDQPATVVIDEFTSVVDRQIARVGAASFAKAWRRTGGKAVALSCHHDIIPWLQPDWVFDTATGEFTGRYLQRRPAIELTIEQTDWRWWPRFEPHHYLKLPHMIASDCYVGFVDGEPVAHVGFSTRPGMIEARAARFVVMPDWQGIGIGLGFLNAVCAEWRRGNNRYGKPMPTLIGTSHPGLTRALRNHPLWVQVSASLYGANKNRSAASLQKRKPDAAGYGGHFRAVQSFRYIEGIELRSAMPKTK